MSDKKPGDGSSPENATEVTKSDASGSRRDALKKTVTVGGVSIALASWTKPVVESVILPAHAQTTSGTLAGLTIDFPITSP